MAKPNQRKKRGGGATVQSVGYQYTGVVGRARTPVVMRGPAMRSAPRYGETGGVRSTGRNPVSRGAGKGVFRFLVLLALLGGGYWALGTYRHEIVERFPQSYRILTAIGIDVPVPVGYGINVVDGTLRVYRMRDELNEPILLVRGRLLNGTAQRLPLPRLRITVSPSSGQPVTWVYTPNETTLAPGQRLDFETRFRTSQVLRDMSARVKFEER